MNIEKLTSQLRSALMAAQSIALGENNPSIEPVHLLKAMIDAQENVISTLISRSGVDLSVLKNQMDKVIAALPRSQNSDGDISLSRSLQRIFN